MSEHRHVCPKCQRGDCLWQAVMISGYVSVDEYLQEVGSPECDGCFYDHNDEFGCSNCGWRGVEEGLSQMGIDDEPLPYIHPEQMILGRVA